MSTRANITITNSADGSDLLWFYRHSDGYPDCTLESLKTFVNWCKDGRIRNNVSQSAGWLIILGHTEYSVANEPGNETAISEWKVGAYEPTTGEHGDIEWLYRIDLATLTIEFTDIYTGKTKVWNANTNKVTAKKAKPAKVW